MYLKKNISKNTEVGKKIYFFTVLILIFLIFILVPRISIPFLCAYLISLMLRPLLKNNFNQKISKKLSVFLILITVIILLTVLVIKVYPLIINEKENIQRYAPQLESILKEKFYAINRSFKNTTGFEFKEQYLDHYVLITKNSLKKVLFEIPDLLASAFEWFFLVPLFLFFLVGEGAKIKRKFLNLVPNAYFENFYYLLFQFDKKIGSYLFAKFIEAILVGAIIWIGLSILSFPFSFIIAIIAGVTNIIPYIGPILGFVPVLLVYFVDPHILSIIGPVLLLYIMVNALDILLFFPLLVSRFVNLHPVIVILSVIIGSQLWGILGMIVSIPLANILKLIIEEIYRELFPSIFKKQ